MPPSGIRVFFDLVLGMKDVISLGVGEPDFSTPWAVREAAIFSIEQGRTSYTSNSGLLELRQRIGLDLERRLGVRYDPVGEILVTVGVSEALDLVMRTVLAPGDEVLIPDPSYVSYGPTVSLAGGVPVSVPTEARAAFKLDPARLQDCVTPRTRALLLNFPANPTGATYTRPELDALAAVARRHDLLVVSDEIYCDLTYDGTHASFVYDGETRSRTVYLNGFSKSFAMTGWRIGYAAGPAAVIAGMTKIHQYTMLCAPIMSQIAACQALSGGLGEVDAMRRDYDRRRRLIVAGLNEIGLDCPMPGGAFYAFPSIRRFGLDSVEFCTQLLQREKVAVVPGSAFGPGGEGHVRLCYAVDVEQIKEALVRIGRFVRGLRDSGAAAQAGCARAMEPQGGTRS